MSDGGDDTVRILELTPDGEAKGIEIRNHKQLWKELVKVMRKYESDASPAQKISALTNVLAALVWKDETLVSLANDCLAEWVKEYDQHRDC